MATLTTASANALLVGSASLPVVLSAAEVAGDGFSVCWWSSTAQPSADSTVAALEASDANNNLFITVGPAEVRARYADVANAFEDRAAAQHGLSGDDWDVPHFWYGHRIPVAVLTAVDLCRCAVMTFDGSDAKFYRDGAELNTAGTVTGAYTPYRYQPAACLTQRWIAGKVHTTLNTLCHSGSGQFALRTAVPGSYDEVRVYDTPLSAQSISTLHHSPGGVDRAAFFLMVYLPFSDARELTYNYGKPGFPVSVNAGLADITTTGSICGESLLICYHPRSSAQQSRDAWLLIMALQRTSATQRS